MKTAMSWMKLLLKINLKSKSQNKNLLPNQNSLSNWSYQNWKISLTMTLYWSEHKKWRLPCPPACSSWACCVFFSSPNVIRLVVKVSWRLGVYKQRVLPAPHRPAQPKNRLHRYKISPLVESLYGSVTSRSIGKFDQWTGRPTDIGGHDGRDVLFQW